MDRETGQYNKRLLNTVVEQILLGSVDYSFVKDTGFVYRAASDAFARMAGFGSAAEVLGKTDYDLFSPELADKYRRDDEAVLREDRLLDGVLEHLPDQDGKSRWVKTWKRALRDETGALVGLYGKGRDMTHVIELEENISAFRNYAELIDHIPGGVGIFHEQNGQFFLDYANDGYYAAHHSTQEHWRRYFDGRGLDCVCEPDRAAVWREYGRVKADGSGVPGSVTYRVRGDDGPHWVNMRFRSAYLRDGVPYYYASFTGMDELKRTELQLRESQESLREAVANADIQFFTYFPGQRRCEIRAVNSRLTGIPRVWEQFPDDFLAYSQVSQEDGQAYRDMLRAIDGGADAAECTVRLTSGEDRTWERVRLTAIRDDGGQVVRAQGYTLNITAQRDAEERIQRERIRQKTLDSDVVEAFSCNVTRDSLVEDASGSPAGGPQELLRAMAEAVPDAGERALLADSFSSEALRRACAAGRFETAITYRRRIEGELHWVSTRAEVLPDPETGDLLAFFYTQDIHNRTVYRKITERVMDTDYETVSFYDLRSGRLHLKQGEGAGDGSFTAVPYAEAVAAAVTRYVVPEEADATRESYRIENILAALEKAPVYSIYYTGRQPDERLPGHPPKRMKSDVFYLDGARDTLVFLQANVTEIFERERDNREKMAAALAAAEQASVAKTEFLSRMSHEIRTPMNAIIGLDAIALQEKDLPAPLEDHLQKIGISARFLLSLINDILDMSRIESGRMMLKNEPFSFEEFINGVNTILYEQCRDSGLDYECVLKSYTEETYVGDATKLQQVLVNLLGNAVKFTPRGGKIRFTVQQLSRTRDTASLRFEVSDTGIGIDEAFLPHLFEAFTQENRGRTSAYGGTGLGLAISKNIIGLMGGDITVHSIKNVGSQFTVDVPLALAEASVRRQRLLAGGMRPLCTLVADDDDAVCRHTQLLLEQAGLKTEWAASGAAAVEKVAGRHTRREDYDLVLLDWKMPDMDGVETAREIRKIVGPEITIIIMTAYDWAEIDAQARAAGVDSFMRKPVFASSVTRAFEDVLLGRQSTAPPRTPDYDFAGKRVLLVEDNAINAEIAGRLLEMKGCAVDTAENGVAAIETFAATPVGHYDAVLMDVRMPVMDGLEAAKAIRAMRKADSRTVPIIAMTANAFQEDVNMSLESGMNAHLAKPIDPPLLYETLRRAFFAESDAAPPLAAHKMLGNNSQEGSL